MPGDGKRKRKGLIWARDGGGAEKHPAYLLDAEDGADAPDGDVNDNLAWIEWASTGAVVQIPKSQIASPLASRRSRTAGLVAKRGAPSQASDDSDSNEVTVTHASNPAVPSPVTSAFMGVNENNCYDYDTDDDNAISAAVAPSPVLSKGVHVKLEGALGYATDEEPAATHQLKLQSAAVARPSPVRSATVKTEKVYAEDTDEEDESAKPSPGSTSTYPSATALDEDTLILIDYCCANWVPESGMMDNHSLTTMPAEIIGRVFSFLSNDRRNAPSFHSIEQTCRSFRDLFGNDEAREMLFPCNITTINTALKQSERDTSTFANDTKKQWASVVVHHCRNSWRPRPLPKPKPDKKKKTNYYKGGRRRRSKKVTHSKQDDERIPNLVELPGEMIGNVLSYLAYDAENLPTMRAVKQTCKTFKWFFDDGNDLTWRILFPSSVSWLVPHPDTEENNAGKLNLWRGELDDTRCGNEHNHLYEWRDMKKGSDHVVKEFVWWVDKRAKTFLCLPTETYTFWSTIKECKTWGDIRAKYTKGFYAALMEMYWRHCGADCFICRFFERWRFSDTMEFDQETQLLDVGSFIFGDADHIPPYIEYIQSSSLRALCYDLFEPFGDWVMNFFGDEHLKFEENERDAIVAAIEASGATAQYEPGLSQFWTIYS